MSKTVSYTSAGVTAQVYACPTDRDAFISIKSHKTNTGNLWVSELADTTINATALGTDCMIVEPGEAVLMRRPGDNINIITTVTAQAFTISNAQSRVR